MIYTLLTSIALMGTADAHTHVNHRKPTHHNTRRHHSNSVVSISWAWVIGHYANERWISGHWLHPANGISHRKHHAGPPPRRPHAKALWVTGHWVNKQGKNVWVRGHWFH
jgi:hypothetical protein